MFPVKAKDILPVHQVVINEISVRGRLGPLTVWVTNDTDTNESYTGTDSTSQSSSHPVAAASTSHRYNLRSRRNPRRSPSSRSTVPVANGQISMRPRHWTKIYSRTHSQSFASYTSLDLKDNPITLRPGQVRGVYVHSTLEGDEAIVYDNKHQESTVDDRFITVLPGRAHVSETPFGSTPIWGWGNAWRDNREFVGQLKYGAVFRLWNPSEHLAFGGKFQRLTWTLFMCQRRWESPFSRLPDDCIFFILNMCHWNWADDSEEEMREMARARRMEARRRLLEEQERDVEAAAAAAASEEKVEEEDGDMKMAAVSSEDLAEAVSSSTEFMVDADEELGDESNGEVEEGGEDDDSDEDDSDYDYEYDEYRNMNTSTFHYCDLDDEDDSAEERRRAAEEEQRRRSYIRSQFARIHVLRALASMSDEGEGGINGS